MRHLTGATRTAFLCFFASHIPITLLIDGQAFLPRGLYPKAVLDLREWYAATCKDSLMTPPFDPWFSSLVAGEILFQLPFFFYAVNALWAPGRVDGRGTFRTMCLVYGSHTSTTLIPILATVLADPATNAAEKATLFGFYFPYLLFPAWLVFIAACSEDVFGASCGPRSKAA